MSFFTMSRGYDLFQAPSFGRCYRLFLEAGGYDATLDHSRHWQNWLLRCTGEGLNIILRHLAPDFLTRPMEERFELALLIGRKSPMKPQGFLGCIGLGPSDPRLPLLKSANGETVLHYIVHHIGWSPHYKLYQQSPKDVLQEWFNFGVSILKNGGDPCCIIYKSDLECILRELGFSYEGLISGFHTPTTIMPLLVCTRVQQCWSSEIDYLTTMLDIITIWAEMIQEAGLPFYDYGVKESRLWESLGIDHPGFDSNYTKVEQLVYGFTPADWSLKVSHSWTVSVYKLCSTLIPGAYIEYDSLPNTLIWPPTKRKRMKVIGRKPRQR